MTPGPEDTAGPAEEAAEVAGAEDLRMLDAASEYEESGEGERIAIAEPGKPDGEVAT